MTKKDIFIRDDCRIRIKSKKLDFDFSEDHFNGLENSINDIEDDQENIFNPEALGDCNPSSDSYHQKTDKTRLVAWLNGKFFTKDNHPSNYKYDENYGTHDWIAESALKLLYSKYLEDGGEIGEERFRYIERLNSNINDLMNYFLLGTEIPDRIKSKLQNYDIEKDPNQSINVSDDIPDVNEHFLRYIKGNVDEHHVVLATQAKEMAEKASKAIINEDDQKSALFLGAMCHYIADVTIYNHVIEIQNPSRHFMNDVDSKTRTPYSKRRKEEEEESFSTDEAWNAFDTKIKIKAEKAVIYAGLDTLYGNNNEKYMNKIPKEHRFTETKYQTPSFLDAFAPHTEDHNDDYWEKRIKVRKKNYKETIQHNLNTAVFYCAAAMNDVISRSF